MKKYIITYFLAMLCLYVQGQQKAITPLVVGQKLKDYTITNILNYPSTSATRSQLQASNSKLLLLDFWFTSCTSCVGQFPKLDSLQKQFKDNLQILLVTREPESVIRPFIEQWEKTNRRKFELTVVTSDTLLNQSFRKMFNPHYAWIGPEGVLSAQTSSWLISESHISAYLLRMKAEVERKRIAAGAAPAKRDE